MGATDTTPAAAPLPPLDLAIRVGATEENAYEGYETVGRALREAIIDALPSDWSFDGKRVLDFGCGAGRTLRHFLDEAATAELWGCDVHAESIDWLQDNLCPPLHCFRSDLNPPLEAETGYFDLVWAMSVFTHITDAWSEWLLELHRVLAPGGLLISTYLGAGTFEAMLGEPYVEDEVGMLVARHWQPPTEAGPWVFHSEWWLREHWGRAFDILEVKRPRLLEDGSTEVTHSHLIARRREGSPTPADLQRIDPVEEREAAALQTNVRMLRRELDAALAGELTAGPPPLRARLRRGVLRSPLGAQAVKLRKRLGPRRAR